ncbi:hypothetical protein Pint_14764 [Pistacia integerrima]|uniref:Uncharacterized protein n=1 Tax=Pistacia integerrima TaxID=434235 RepID=A0ACC0Y6D6_9ROSI|nr:hypothetical protein Pint_14764 [Pistacia integerrima]
MDIEGNRRSSQRRRDVFWSYISCFFTDLFSSISSLVCQGYELLCEHKQRALAVFFVMLETISLVLDVFGQSRRIILLAAFLLSVFGFVMTVFTCILERTKVHAEKQLGVVEIGFSVVQLIASFLAVLGVKSANNYTASVLLLVFSVIAAVFIFRKDVDRIKGPWSPEEDEALFRLVQRYGQRDWYFLSEWIPGRSAKSCRLRWGYLEPELKARDQARIQADRARSQALLEHEKRLFPRFNSRRGPAPFEESPENSGTAPAPPRFSHLQ